MQSLNVLKTDMRKFGSQYGSRSMLLFYWQWNARNMRNFMDSATVMAEFRLTQQVICCESNCAKKIGKAQLTWKYKNLSFPVEKNCKPLFANFSNIWCSSRHNNLYDFTMHRHTVPLNHFYQQEPSTYHHLCKYFQDRFVVISWMKKAVTLVLQEIRLV